MSRYISKLPEPIRELAEKRRSEQNPKCKEDLLSIAFDWFITPEGIEFWREINKENYSVFYEKNAQDNCTCNSRTVDESGNVVHFEECEKEKDKLDELIEWMEQELWRPRKKYAVESARCKTPRRSRAPWNWCRRPKPRRLSTKL